MNIPISSPSGFIGLVLLAIGGFMLLAGFDIISIRQVTVQQGRRTWVLGAVFAVIGASLFYPEFTSSMDTSDTKAAPEPAPTTAETSPTELSKTLNEWIPIGFLIANSNLWRDTAEGIYTAMGSEDAFAWSMETYDGNLMVSLDLESSASQSSGCVIIYGDGQDYSYGSLFFCVDWDGYGLEKHTIYHEGENRLVFTPGDVDLREKVYSVTIEIRDDVASMYVNGEQVLSSFFDTEEIDRSGRIGLLKKWWDPEITFSNIKIRMPGNGD